MSGIETKVTVASNGAISDEQVIEVEHRGALFRWEYSSPINA